jgi:hypothetical protein
MTARPIREQPLVLSSANLAALLRPIGLLRIPPKLGYKADDMLLGGLASELRLTSLNRTENTSVQHIKVLRAPDNDDVITLSCNGTAPTCCQLQVVPPSVAAAEKN